MSIDVDQRITRKLSGAASAIALLRSKLPKWTTVLLVVVSVAAGATLHRGYDIWRGKNYYHGESSFLRSDMERTAQNIEFARQQAEGQLQALTSRVAELQARIVRLDALGERLVAMQSLDADEFDFSSAPAMGGPEITVAEEESRPDFMRSLDQLAADIERREEQLSLLEKLMSPDKHADQTLLSGLPVKKGRISSGFGFRLDPLTGRRSRHEGVDFPGKVGADIQSVGDGVVTWAGERFGYGKLVEINHGKGFVTRYGHASSIAVRVGQTVKRGDVVARMGNTGRSTGTHLHFEVLRDGVALDPVRVIFKRG